MACILPRDWRPSGVDDLEPNAWRALTKSGCTCVVAGPGAGKTEFLAQRAVYLLETSTCPPPRRVLAISFKSDAADNLAARVRQRCPPELAGRFVSLTFDAFTKGLVDRFLPSIPPDWRPSRPYDITFPSRRQVEDFLDLARLSAPPTWQAEIAGLGPSNFESRIVGSMRISPGRTEPQTATEYAIDRWWSDHLRGGKSSSLTFVTLNRLAELLLRINPQIRRALRATYPFVFVDEFQDTAYAQYDFLLSAFADHQTAVTAVGDDKQRIMIWAGARIDAFQRFEADFAAQQIALQFNFRSSPDLVHIQQVVARALEPNPIRTIAKVARQVNGDVAQVWNSTTSAIEAEYLANWLREDMARRGRAPRDYALLVRQKADEYEAELNGALADVRLQIRNESRVLGRTTLQDLLADELGRIAIALLRLSATRRAPESWRFASTAVETIRAVDPADDMAGQRADAELTAFLAELRASMATCSPTVDNAIALAERIFNFLDLTAVARTYTQYRLGDLQTIMVEAFALYLAECADGASDWVACLDAFEGISQIPLMTVHKSKGLE